MQYLLSFMPPPPPPRGRKKRAKGGPRRITPTPIHSVPVNGRTGKGKTASQEGGGGDCWSNPAFTSASLASEPPSPISEERKLLQQERSQQMRNKLKNVRGRLEMTPECSSSCEIGRSITPKAQLALQHSNSNISDNLGRSVVSEDSRDSDSVPQTDSHPSPHFDSHTSLHSSSQSTLHSHTGINSITSAASPGTSLPSATQSPVPETQYGSVSPDNVDCKQELAILSQLYAQTITGQ